MNDTIMRYVRDKKNRKIGMLVAKEFNDTLEVRPFVNIGWSLCRPGDIFSRDLGYSQAIDNLGKSIPPSIEKDVKRFRVQCFLYFQNAMTTIQNPNVMERGLQPRKPHDGLSHNSGHRSGCSEGSRSQSGCECRELAKAEERVNREQELVGQVMVEQ